MIPTFFIAGAPRCGTSSLGHSLAAHPRGLRWRSQRAAQLLLPAYTRASLLASRAPTRLLRTSAAFAVGGLFYAPTMLNLGAARRPRLSREVGGALCEQLRDDVARLSDLLSRDLSAWLKPDAP